MGRKRGPTLIAQVFMFNQDGVATHTYDIARDFPGMAHQVLLDDGSRFMLVHEPSHEQRRKVAHLPMLPRRPFGYEPGEHLEPIPKDELIKRLKGELLWVWSELWPLVHGLTCRETLRERFRQLPDWLNCPVVEDAPPHHPNCRCQVTPVPIHQPSDKERAITAAVKLLMDEGLLMRAPVVGKRFPPSIQERPDLSREDSLGQGDAIPLFTFGPYRNEPHEEILKVNPGYIKWAYETVANHGGIAYRLYAAACQATAVGDPEDFDPADMPDPPRAWGDLTD